MKKYSTTMKKNALLAVVLLLLGAATPLHGQRWTSHSFAETQAGLQFTATDAPMDKLTTPRAAFALGHYFTPIVGARLHLSASEAKSGFKDLAQYYKWKNITPSMDLMIHLSNLLGANQNRALNLIVLGGVGLSYAWDNDELAALGVAPQRVPLRWDSNRLSHNLRAGLRIETNQRKPFGLSLEVDANSIGDRFNSKSNDADDWQFTAMIGLNYRFGYKGRKRAPVAREEIVTIWKDVPEEIVEYVDIPVEGLANMRIRREVFYDIRVSDNEDAEKAQKEVFQFMNEYEKVRVTITGYADIGTGNERLNMMYSQRRAENFKKELVEKFGCDPEAISVDWKGDTVQPFEENDKNRCVIVEAEGLKRTQKMERQERRRTIIKKVEQKIRVKR
jgi:hypothetical protein